MSTKNGVLHVLAALTLVLSGCASISLSLQAPGQRHYSFFCQYDYTCMEGGLYLGTRVNFDTLMMRGGPGPGEGAGLGGLAPLLMWPVALVDLPLSLIADTLMLPFQFYASRSLAARKRTLHGAWYYGSTVSERQQDFYATKDACGEAGLFDPGLEARYQQWDDSNRALYRRGRSLGGEFARALLGDKGFEDAYPDPVDWAGVAESNAQYRYEEKRRDLKSWPPESLRKECAAFEQSLRDGGLDYARQQGPEFEFIDKLSALTDYERTPDKVRALLGTLPPEIE